MWDKAVVYLKAVKVLDFNHKLQEWALRERVGVQGGAACLFAPTVMRKGAGQGGVGARLWDSMLVKLQDWWDHECGINTCHAE